MAQNTGSIKKDRKITWKEVKRQKFLMIVAFFMVAYGVVFYYWPLTGWLMAFENYKPKKGLLGFAIYTGVLGIVVLILQLTKTLGFGFTPFGG